jgi:hypothetical protein
VKNWRGLQIYLVKVSGVTYALSGRVSYPHPFHEDPDRVQNLNADLDLDPEPGCQLNAAGSGFRPLCNNVLVILVLINQRLSSFHSIVVD